MGNCIKADKKSIAKFIIELTEDELLQLQRDLKDEIEHSAQMNEENIKLWTAQGFKIENNSLLQYCINHLETAKNIKKKIDAISPHKTHIGN